ncbi:MAG: MFS transporter [Candidatus Latescibacteria bacterium]|nr:MFS transporter [Candidatus Latescibacterota bacterium]
MGAQASSGAVADDGQGQHPYRWAVLAGVWLVYFCFGLTSAALPPLVSVIRADLSLSASAMGSILGAWQLVYIGAAIPLGLALDRMGLRRALLAAVLIIALSGGLRATAEDHFTLFLAVALFGIGGPLISIGAPKLVAVWFGPRQRGLAMGLYMTGPALGGIVSLTMTNSIAMPLAGGNWRWVFLAYAGFVLLASAAWLLISAHPAVRASELGAKNAKREPQGDVFRALLQVRAVRLLLLMSIGLFFFSHGLNNWLPEILRAGGMSAKSSGVWAAIPVAIGIVAAILIPRLAIPQRRYRVMLCLLVCGLGASLLLQAQALPITALGLVLQGIGQGTSMIIAMLILVEQPEVGAQRAGTAGGLFFAFAEIGGVLGPLSLGVIFDATNSFSPALAVLTAIMVLLVFLLLRLRKMAPARA